MHPLTPSIKLLYTAVLEYVVRNTHGNISEIHFARCNKYSFQKKRGQILYTPILMPSIKLPHITLPKIAQRRKATNATNVIMQCLRQDMKTHSTYARTCESA